MNLTDPEIEDLLRRYRPVGPPAELRQRILTATRAQRAWPWVSAAAALLLAAGTLQRAAEHEAASAGLDVEPAAVVRLTDELTEMLGGDAAARRMAELAILEQQVYSEPTAPAMNQAEIDDGRNF